MATPDTTACTPLRRAREARGLRLEDLASAAGVSIRTVFDAERGRHEPRRSSKAVIARALELDVAALWPPDEAA